MAHLFSSDDDDYNPRIRLWNDGYNSTIKDTITLSIVNGIEGISWDGDEENVLIATTDGYPCTYIKCEGWSQTILDSFNGDFDFPSDFHWDGVNLIDTIQTQAFDGEYQRYKYSGFTSTVVDSFTAIVGEVNTTDDSDGNVLTADYVNNKHRKYDGFTTTVLDSYGGIYADGMTWTGFRVIHGDFLNDNKIKLHAEGFTSTITDSWAGPNDTNSMEWTPLTEAEFNSDAICSDIATPFWVSPDDGAELSSTPTFVFTMPKTTGDMHFNLQIDTANTFDTADLRDIETNENQTGWEYWDGDSWVPVPATGVPSSYWGNNCRYTVQTPLTQDTWYRRVRAAID